MRNTHTESTVHISSPKNLTQIYTVVYLRLSVSVSYVRERSKLLDLFCIIQNTEVTTVLLNFEVVVKTVLLERWAEGVGGGLMQKEL